MRCSRDRRGGNNALLKSGTLKAQEASAAGLAELARGGVAERQQFQEDLEKLKDDVKQKSVLAQQQLDKLKEVLDMRARGEDGPQEHWRAFLLNVGDGALPDFTPAF